MLFISYFITIKTLIISLTTLSLSCSTVQRRHTCSLKCSYKGFTTLQMEWIYLLPTPASTETHISIYISQCRFKAVSHVERVERKIPAASIMFIILTSVVQMLSSQRVIIENMILVSTCSMWTGFSICSETSPPADGRRSMRKAWWK